MEKLELQTKDLKKENIEKLNELFPEILTEIEKDGQFIKTINVDKLKELVGDYADKEKEVYELSWAGKQKAKMKVYEPINKTLRPVIEDSVDFENTENLYIEGDNFEVLKLLKESYANKVKMIYIDPPYNTGKDFVYKDNFKSSKGEYEDKAGLVDDDGNRLYTPKPNEKTNPWYHSDWLNMMYERLSLAYKLLRKDGVIFISIDDNEVHNLRKVCDEIFGENNIETLIWNKEAEGSSGTLKQTSTTRRIHEYVICVFKDSNNIQFNKVREALKGKEDELQTANLAVNEKNERKNHPNYFPIINPNGKTFTRQWKWDKNKIDDLIRNDLIYWGSDGNKQPRLIIPTDDRRTTFLLSILNYGGTTVGRRDFENLLGADIEFSYPKPVILIKKILETSTSTNDLILDFFSGSATTAHAVMQLNAEDQGNRKYIMVQLPEKTDEKSEAYKAGYKNICEIGKERIRRAAKKIQEENKDKDLSNIDFGFRVFKLDDSNMKDVYYNPKKINQSLLQNFNEVVKEDRTSEDLLFQVMLSMGVPISEKVEIKEIENTKVFKVANYLIACFEKDISQETIKKIVELKPLRIVFKESCFKDDSAMINASEYIKNVLFDGDEKNFKNNVKLI